MPLKIHQVICSGRFEHEAPLEWKVTKVNFYNNVLKLTRFNFTAHITKNICYLFHNHLYRLLKNRIENTIEGEVNKLDVKVTNILYSTTLNYDHNTLIKKFLPILNEKFYIDVIEITQEQNTPAKVSLQSILNSDGLSYMALNIKVLNRRANIKLQLNKEKQLTHTTIILPDFNCGARELIKFFAKNDGFKNY